MKKYIVYNKHNSFLEPINQALNTRMTKESFNYAISLISKVANPKEKLNTFNQFMEYMYIKVAERDVSPELTQIMLGEETSDHLSNFLNTFGNNWKEIKKNIPAESLGDLDNALTYSKNNIKFKALQDSDLIMDREKRVSLIRTLELDDQKESFLSPEAIQKLSFSSDDISKILCSFKFDSRKLQYLTANLDSTISSLAKKNIVEIINSLHYDSNKLKFFKPTNIEALGLSDVDIAEIIKNLEHDSNKIKALEDEDLAKTRKLAPEQIESIIKSLENDKSKLGFLNKTRLNKIFKDFDYKQIRAVTTGIICSLQEDKSKLQFLTPEKVAEFGLMNFNIALITTTLTNDDEKKKIINMKPVKGKHPLNLNSKNISRIVSSFQKDEDKIAYLQSLPSNGEHASEKARIVSSLKSVPKIKEFLEKDPELAKYKNALLLGMFSDKKTVSRTDFDTVCEMAGIDPQELHSLSIPVLPNNMTVGVELETVGLNNEGNARSLLFKEFRKVFGGFDAKRDTSLEGYDGAPGVEIISPILMNHNLENLNLVAKLIQMNDLGVNDTCGAHIHIGADYLDSTEALQNLSELYFNNEDLFYQIINHSGDALRGGAKEFARTLSPKVKEAIKKGTIHINSPKDLGNFIEELKKLQYGRHGDFPHIVEANQDNPNFDPDECDYHKYFGLNLKNINCPNKNTIEFRIANGTVDPQTLMDNIRLVTSLFDISKELGDIEKAIKQNKPITQEQAELFKARQDLARITEQNPDDPKARLDALLKLVMFKTPECAKVYTQRYDAFPKNSLEGISFERIGYRHLPNPKKIEMPAQRSSLFLTIAHYQRDYMESQNDMQTLLEKIVRPDSPITHTENVSSDVRNTGTR